MKGEKWDNCNSIINKSILKKERSYFFFIKITFKKIDQYDVIPEAIKQAFIYCLTNSLFLFLTFFALFELSFQNFTNLKIMQACERSFRKEKSIVL